MKPISFSFAEYERLKAENEQLRAERDAAVEDILIAHDRGRCEVCMYKRSNGGECNKWPDRSCFKWHGTKGTV